MLFELHGHTRRLLTSDFSRDSNLLLTGGLDKQVILWDLKSGQIVKRISDQPDIVTQVLFAPSSSEFLAVSGKSARIWNVSADKESRSINLKAVFLTDHAVFSPNGTSIAIAYSFSTDRPRDLNHAVVVVDAASLKEIFRAESPDEEFTHLAFSPDGKELFAATKRFNSSDTKLVAWSTQFSGGKTGFEAGKREIKLNHQNEIRSIQISEDQSNIVLYTDSLFGYAVVLDYKSLEEKDVFHGYRDRTRLARMSAEGAVIATTGEDDTLRIWDSQAQAYSGVSAPVSGNMLDIRKASNAQYIAVRDANSIKILDYQSNRLIAEQHDRSGTPEAFFSPDGKLVASFDPISQLPSHQGNIFIAPIADPAHERKIDVDRGNIILSRFAANSSMVLAVCDWKAIIIYDIGNEKVQLVGSIDNILANERAMIEDAAFSSGGSRYW